MSRSVADLLFAPRSIVVYGASSDPEKLSGRPLDYLKKLGYGGGLHAVNPRRDVVQGVPAHASIADVPGPVDLAVIVVPADKVPGAIEECAAAGVGAATVFASGFSEAPNGVGVEAQERMAEASRRSGMRVLGPNCLGSFALPEKAFATFSTAFDTPGALPDSPIALVSQSGAVGTFTYSTMTSVGLGVRFFANTGNEVDITVVEVLDALVDHDDVELLLGHLEGFTDPAALERLASRAASAGKPLVLLKAGRTSVGQRAIGAHTGSRGGDDAEFDAVLARHGAIRATSMEEMADLALAFAPGRRVRGRRVTVVTQSGGAGALASDVAVDVGLEIEPWDDATRARVAALLPFFASTANPIDVTGALINDVGILDKTLQISLESDETDVVLVVLGNSDRAAEELVETCVRHHDATDKPFLIAWTGGTGKPRLDLLEAGVPTYAEPVRAVRAIGHLVDHSLRSTRMTPA
ncbi:acetate--CoA ligase family protein [Geodermatophilus sp. CPCC 205506]|uniref:acetate--CoA ligase family protein n=1 Tax=Geodermatophilus sp. CPCC 205506 TaxID=2936596 RepID=UPI003EEC25C9